MAFVPVVLVCVSFLFIQQRVTLATQQVGTSQHVVLVLTEWSHTRFTAPLNVITPVHSGSPPYLFLWCEYCVLPHVHAHTHALVCSMVFY